MGKFYKISEVKEYQQRVINKLKDEDSLLVYHGLGSGKTLTALEAGEQLGMPVEVIGPASLKENFSKEKKKHNVHIPVSYHSYSKPPSQGDVNTGDKLLVFDEAHNMGRLESARSKYPDQYYGRKTLFLTGTPIRNTPDELIPIMRGLGVGIPRDKQKFNELFVNEKITNPGFLSHIFLGVKPGVSREAKNMPMFKKLLRGKVDYYAPGSVDYPSVTETTKDVEMSKAQYETYKEMMRGKPSLAYKIKHGLPPSKTEASSLNAFLNASRQISNTPHAFNLRTTSVDEPKLNAAVSEIIKREGADKNYKGVTYSNYLESGVAPMAERLRKTNIPFAEFTGKLSDNKKKEVIEQYNKGKIKQLLISGAGSEGLDLKGTKLMQILEPHWNDPRVDQVIGRAVRFKSHEDLPENERKVEIQRFNALPRKHGIFFKKRDMGADQYLSMLSKQKTDLNNTFLTALQEVGSK